MEVPAGVPGLNRSRTSRSDPSGLCRAETFWNSFGSDLSIAVPQSVPAFLPTRGSVGPRSSGEVRSEPWHTCGYGQGRARWCERAGPWIYTAAIGDEIVLVPLKAALERNCAGCSLSPLAPCGSLRRASPRRAWGLSLSRAVERGWGEEGYQHGGPVDSHWQCWGRGGKMAGRTSRRTPSQGSGAWRWDRRQVAGSRGRQPQ